MVSSYLQKICRVLPLLSFSLFALVLGLAASYARAQVMPSYTRWAKDYAVLASAQAQSDPPAIRLSWPVDSEATEYRIYRKAVDGIVWGTPIETLSGSAVGYTDTNIVTDVAYEYKIERDRPTPNGNVIGTGYVACGIELSVVHDRGTVVLLLETMVATKLPTEVAQLKQDLIGDGWRIIQHVVDRSASADSVKALIRADVANPGNDIEAVYILGHLPVFSCGNYSPDDYSNGPFRTDSYYGELAGDWTSQTDILPADVTLQVGRVDLFDMFSSFDPGIPTQLPRVIDDERMELRRYLIKDHKFRHKIDTTVYKGVVVDRLRDRDEGIAQNGYRNIAALFGAANVREETYLTTNKYAFGFACATGGDYDSNPAVGSSSSVRYYKPQTLFMILYGDRIPYWNYADSLLRSFLCTDVGLASIFGGRPNLFYHHMAIGETLGYCTRLSQNNPFSLYTPEGAFARYSHVTLMGDPTLRLHVVAPPSALTSVLSSEGKISLQWNAPVETGILGYYVYRSSAADGPFTRMTDPQILENVFVDADPLPGMNYYMVRAVKLEKGSGASYYNLSQGIFTSVNVRYGTDLLIKADFERDFSGDNLYFPPTAQGKVGVATGPITYYVKLQNEGSVSDRFLISLTGDFTGWTVQCFDAPAAGGTDVIADIQAGAYSVDLAAGATRIYRIVCTPDITLAPPALLGVGFTATSDNDVTKTDTVTMAISLAEVHSPDMTIRNPVTDVEVGATVYETPGAITQSMAQRVQGGETASYYFTVTNRGNMTEQFTLTGTRSVVGWGIRYFDQLTGDEEITDAMGAFRTAALAPGESAGYRVDVTPAASLPRNSRKVVDVKVSSNFNPAITDVIRGTTDKLAESHPDLSIRLHRDHNYTGERIFNSDGTNQTVVNDGNTNIATVYQLCLSYASGDAVKDQFVIRGSAGGPGWQVRYFNSLQGGVDVTAQVTGAGWSIPTLLPIDGKTYFRAEVTGTPLSPAGDVYTLLINATSVADALNPDVVRADTTKVDFTAVDLTTSIASPARAMCPVRLTAAPTGGGNLEYCFMAQLGDEDWVILRDYEASDSFVWTPTLLGRYTLQVNARQIGNPAEFEQQDSIADYFVVPGSLTAVTLDISPQTPQVLGAQMTLTAGQVGGGSDIQYWFRVYNGSTWSDLPDSQPYSTVNTYTWTPTRGGNYTLRVFGRDVFNGVTTVKSIDKPFTITVPAPAPKLTAVALQANMSSPRPINTPITLQATATGGQGVTYRFRVYDGISWTDLTVYTPDNTYLWTPDSAGNYKLAVYAREVRNGVTTEKTRTISYTITFTPPPGPKLTAVRLQASVPSPQPVNTSITLRAIPTGGVNVLYRFRIYDGTNWTDLRGFAAGDTITWCPTAKRTYTLRVYAKENGAADLSQVLGSMTFIIR